MNGRDQLNKIEDERGLDDLIEKGVLLQRGGLIDFDEGAPVILIDDDIISEQLEAVRIIRDIELAGDQRLGADLLDLLDYMSPTQVRVLLLQLPSYLQ